VSEPGKGHAAGGHDDADTLFVMDELDHGEFAARGDSHHRQGGRGGGGGGGGGGGVAGGGREGEGGGGEDCAGEGGDIAVVDRGGGRSGGGCHHGGVLVGLLRHARLRVLDLSNTDIAVANLLLPTLPPAPRHWGTQDWRAGGVCGGVDGGGGCGGGDWKAHRGLPVGLRVLKLNGCGQ
jgi:hypothetical protein